MKRFALYFILSVLMLTACTDGDKATQTAKPVDTIPVMVMQIRKCSKLYTAEYRVRKIVTHDDDVRLKGSMFNQKFDFSMPLSSRKIAIPMEAKLKAYIDFGSFSEQNIAISGDKVEITLPDPRVELTSSRIDHDGIKKHVAFMRSRFTDAEMASYEQQGRRQIIQSIPQMGIIEMARQSAAHALVPILAQMGYKEENITITFRKDFTTGDLPMLLDDNSIEYGKYNKQQ